jgi:hypothetical protein
MGCGPADTTDIEMRLSQTNEGKTIELNANPFRQADNFALDVKSRL